MSLPTTELLVRSLAEAIEASAGWTCEQQVEGDRALDAYQAKSQGWSFLVCAPPAGESWKPAGTAASPHGPFHVVHLPDELVEAALRKARTGT